MDGPFRASSFVICPRCGELLDRAFDDVYACMRCNGLWVSAPSIAIAFGDSSWPPHARSLWWKSVLPCPECARIGMPSTLESQLCDGVQIDRCATHGLWLDPGELGRLAGSTGDELAELRRRLRGEEQDVSRLEERRSAWRRELDARRRSAEEYQDRLAADRARQIEEADARAHQDQVVRQRADHEARGRVLEQLHASRAELASGIDRLEERLVGLRGELRALEAQLEGDRMKLRALDRRLEELEAEIPT